MGDPGHAPRLCVRKNPSKKEAGRSVFLNPEEIPNKARRENEDSDQLDEFRAVFPFNNADHHDREVGLDDLTDVDDRLTEEHSRFLENVAGDDSISLYLKEMARVPLLSMEEEIRLAQQIERGRQSSLELLRLNNREKMRRRKELEAQIQEGALARDYLIRANTRLVVSVARRYLGRGVPFLDLIQEGNLGLIRAVEKYDYQRGFRFSTYATWWIRQSISRSIADQGRTIRVPVHMTDRIRQMYKIAQELEQTLGRSPTAQELAAVMEVDGAKVRWMQEVSQSPLSLENQFGDDDTELGMNVEDVNAPSPAQVTYQNLLRERIEEVLSTLSPREARVLRLRFGLGHDRAYTLEEVGQKFGLTRERIRQIEGRALRMLRQPSRAHLLRELM